jgi:hypothetical protein
MMKKTTLIIALGLFIGSNLMAQTNLNLKTGVEMSPMAGPLVIRLQPQMVELKPYHKLLPALAKEIAL